MDVKVNWGNVDSSEILLDELVSAFRSRFDKQSRGLREEAPEFHDFRKFYESVFEWELQPYFVENLEYLTSDDVNALQIIIPPGHGKSALLSSWTAWMLGRNPNLRVIVATHTLEYSQRLIEYICTILNHPVSRRIFGDLIPESSSNMKWTLSVRYLRRSDFRLKDPSLCAVAVGSSTIGYRADIVIGDDLVTQANSMTPVMRQHVRDWVFKSLFPRLDLGGKIRFAGTRFYKGDLYEDLESRGIKTISFKSTPENPLWPEGVPSDIIRRAKELDYAAYMAQYEHSPIDYSGQFLNESWLSYYIAEPPDLRFYMGVDPCAKDRAGTDPLAITIIGVDINRTVYVVDLIEKQASFQQSISLIRSLAVQYQPVLIGIESNGAQGWISEELIERGIPASRITNIQNQLPKAMRFQEMAGLFRKQAVLLPGATENGFIVPHPRATSFVKQWVDFPSNNDHLLDSTACAIQAAIRLGVEPATGMVGQKIGVFTSYAASVPTNRSDSDEEEEPAFTYRYGITPIFH